MRKIACAIGLLFGAIAVQPAAAADLPVKAPVMSAPLAPSNWTGFYIGGHAGGAWSDVDWSNVSFMGPDSFSFRRAGFAGGGHAGFNYQVGSLVLGVEGAWTWTDLSKTVLDTFGLITLTSKIDQIGTVVGRVGYGSDRWLAYVSGGFAWGRLTTSTALTGCCLPGNFRAQDTETGWTVGGGFEYMLTENLIAGVDYKYVDLGTTTRTGLTNIQIPVTITGIDTTVQMATARLSYKFGWPR